MKKTIILLVLAVFLAAPVFSQEVNKTHLTLYSRYGLVDREFLLEFKKGFNEFIFSDVPGTIEKGSFLILPKKENDEITFTGYKYLSEVMNTGNILQKNLNNQIEIFLRNEGSIQGKLLFLDGQYIVIEDSGGKTGFINRYDITRINLNINKEEFSKKPHFTVTASAEKAGKFPARMTYMSNSYNWQTFYTSVYSEKDNTLGISTRIQVMNNSKKTVQNASLTLVSGEPGRLGGGRNYARNAPNMMAKVAESAPSIPGFEASKQFEYHVFEYEGKISLLPGQTNELELYPHQKVKVDKVYKYNGRSMGEKVAVILDFTNEKKNGLGVPLPQGRMKIYKKKTDDALLFLGEAGLGFVPVKKKTSISIGNAFDLTGKRKLTDQKKIDRYTREESYSIEILNSSDKTVQILVEEYISGEWKIINNTLPYSKIDARRVEFVLKIKPESTGKITYTARIK